MNIINQTANKPYTFYELAFRRLQKLDRTFGRRVIRYPAVFYELGTIFHLSRDEVKIILSEMRELGLIEIVPFNGIRLKGEQK